MNDSNEIRNLIKEVQNNEYPVDRENLWLELEGSLKKRNRYFLLFYVSLIASIIFFVFYFSRYSTSASFLPPQKPSANPVISSTNDVPYPNALDTATISNRKDIQIDKIRLKREDDLSDKNLINSISNQSTAGENIALELSDISLRIESNNYNEIARNRFINRTEKVSSNKDYNLIHDRIEPMVGRIKMLDLQPLTSLDSISLDSIIPIYAKKEKKSTKRFSFGVFYGKTMAKYITDGNIISNEGWRTPFGLDFEYGIQFDYFLNKDYFLRYGIYTPISKATLLKNTNHPLDGEFGGARSRSYVSPDFVMSLKFARHLSISRFNFYAGIGPSLYLSSGDAHISEFSITPGPGSIFPKMGNIAILNFGELKQIGLSMEVGKNIRFFKQQFIGVSLNYHLFTKTRNRETLSLYTSPEEFTEIAKFKFKGSYASLRIAYLFKL